MTRFLAQNKMLNQSIDELVKKLSMLLQQLKEIHELPKQRQIAYRELCISDHPDRFCPPAKE